MKDSYQEITDAIVEGLEAVMNGGKKPSWIRPWSSCGSPRNAFTSRAYTGINAFIMSMKMTAKGWDDARFATYAQISKEGGQVRKGEKGTQVVLWKFFEKIEDGKKKTIPMLRTFTVFNVKAQADGIELKAVVKPNNEERDSELDSFINETGASIVHGGDCACFNIVSNTINLPPFEHFKSRDAYYSTAFHELIHWTAKNGSERDLTGRFGSDAYAFEELVAELGNSFLCQSKGVDGNFNENHLPYIASWLKVLKNDKRAIFKAASLANAAVKVLTGETVSNSEETVSED